MLILKIIFHIQAAVLMIFYRLIYLFGGGKFLTGKHLTFRKGFSVMIDKHGEIVIGNNVFFNNYCSLNAIQHISIGDGTIFGENIKVYDHNHCYKDSNVPIKEQGFTSAPVNIGKHCWIASNVVILKGVTIGDNCVIGAGCIVYKDVPANTVVVNKQELLYKYQNTDNHSRLSN